MTPYYAQSYTNGDLNSEGEKRERRIKEESNEKDDFWQ